MRRALVYVGRAAVLVITFPIVAASYRHGGIASALGAAVLVGVLAVALLPVGDD